VVFLGRVHLMVSFFFFDIFMQIHLVKLYGRFGSVGRDERPWRLGLMNKRCDGLASGKVVQETRPPREEWYPMLAGGNRWILGAMDCLTGRCFQSARAWPLLDNGHYKPFKRQFALAWFPRLFQQASRPLARQPPPSPTGPTRPSPSRTAFSYRRNIPIFGFFFPSFFTAITHPSIDVLLSIPLMTTRSPNGNCYDAFDAEGSFLSYFPPDPIVSC